MTDKNDFACPTAGIKEVASFLGHSDQSIREKAKRGELPGFKVGNKWRFRWEKILEYVENLERMTREINVIDIKGSKELCLLAKRKILHTGIHDLQSAESEYKSRRDAILEKKRKSMRISANEKFAIL